jgi:hypothetical protein
MFGRTILMILNCNDCKAAEGEGPSITLAPHDKLLDKERYTNNNSMSGVGPGLSAAGLG